MTAGLVNRWKFNETAGTNAADSAGTNTGTLTNGPTFTTGQSGNAVALDGTNDYVATGGLGTLGGTSTLSAWIKTTQVGASTFWTAPGIAGVEQYWGSNDVFWGIIDAQGRIGVKAGDDAAASSTTAINDGVWHHIAFTRNAGTGALQVFVDGVLEGTATGAVGTKSTPFNSIGRIENTNGPANHLQGSLDDVRVYNRVLTAQEVIDVRANIGS